jgi:hypothetical protein
MEQLDRTDQAEEDTSFCCDDVASSSPAHVFEVKPPRGPRCVAGSRTGAEQYCTNERSVAMLWTLALILVVLWMLGVTTSYTVGGLIHILLVVALVAVVVRLFQGRRFMT